MGIPLPLPAMWVRSLETLRYHLADRLDALVQGKLDAKADNRLRPTILAVKSANLTVGSVLCSLKESGAAGFNKKVDALIHWQFSNLSAYI